MNHEQEIYQLMQAINPRLLEASTALVAQCGCLTSLFMDYAKVDPSTATLIAAIAIGDLCELLKANPGTLNQYINQYKNNG